jgi:hypothetical protein
LSHFQLITAISKSRLSNSALACITLLPSVQLAPAKKRWNPMLWPPPRTGIARSVDTERSTASQAVEGNSVNTGVVQTVRGLSSSAWASGSKTETPPSAPPPPEISVVGTFSVPGPVGTFSAPEKLPFSGTFSVPDFRYVFLPGKYFFWRCGDHT